MVRPPVLSAGEANMPDLSAVAAVQGSHAAKASATEVSCTRHQYCQTVTFDALRSFRLQNYRSVRSPCVQANSTAKDTASSNAAAAKLRLNEVQAGTADGAAIRAALLQHGAEKSQEEQVERARRLTMLHIAMQLTAKLELALDRMQEQVRARLTCLLRGLATCCKPESVWPQLESNAFCYLVFQLVQTRCQHTSVLLDLHTSMVYLPVEVRSHLLNVLSMMDSIAVAADEGYGR